MTLAMFFQRVVSFIGSIEYDPRVTKVNVTERSEYQHHRLAMMRMNVRNTFEGKLEHYCDPRLRTYVVTSQLYSHRSSFAMSASEPTLCAFDTRL